MDAVATARTAIEDRVTRHPASPFYQFATTEMIRIDKHIADQAPVDRAFYESLTRGIGLMCARELEASDPAFCDAVYGMIEDFRLRSA